MAGTVQVCSAEVILYAAGPVDNVWERLVRRCINMKYDLR